jgi:HSP20 family molecular chaperone IbpA
MAKIIPFRPRRKKSVRSASVPLDPALPSGFDTLIAQVLNEETAALVKSGKVQVRSAVEMLENADSLRIRFALPGLQKDQIRITFKKNCLKVWLLEEGNKEPESHSLPIPAIVDAETAFAFWDAQHQMLVVDFPKIKDEDENPGVEIPIA